MTQNSSKITKSAHLAQEDALVVDENESFMEYWLIMPKLLCFMLNVFVYALHGLITFFFIKSWGYTYYQYGYATSVLVTNFFGSMFWSSMADRTGKYKIIIITTSIVYTVIACSMTYVDGSTIIRKVGIFCGFAVFNFFLSAVFPLVDAQILGSLAKNPKLSKDQFNNQRMWGAVGHFFATLLSFFLYKKNEPSSAVWFQIVVTIIFVALVWFGVEDVAPVKHGHHGDASGEKNKKIESSDNDKEEIHQVPVTDAPEVPLTPAPFSANEELTAEGTQGQKHPVVVLLTNPSFMFFMIFVLSCGVIRSITSSFQKLLADAAVKHRPKFLIDSFNYLFSNEDTAKQVSIAMIDFGRMLSEIAVYLFAKPLKYYCGVYWIIVASQVVGIVRVFGYAGLDTNKTSAFYYAVLLELLKGFSSGLVSSSAIPIASRIAPAGCETTAQGLFSGNYSGLSMALGGLIGGGILHYLYEDDPGQLANTQDMYFYVASGSLVVTIILAFKFIFIDRVMGVPGYYRKNSLPS